MFLNLPHALRKEEIHSQLASLNSEKVFYYYKLPAGSTAQAVAPTTGKVAGTHIPHDSMPPRSAFSTLTIVSKPSRPDNSRQTIYQPSSPPDLRITTELELPNVIVQAAKPEISKPSLPLRLQGPKPLAPNTHADSVGTSAPPAIPTNQGVTLSQFAEAQPRVQIAPLAAPRKVESTSNDLPLREGNGLVVLGVNPSEAVSELVLPAGNRWGEFSVSAAGGQPTAPDEKFADPGGTDSSANEVSSRENAVDFTPGPPAGETEGPGSPLSVTVTTNVGGNGLLRIDTVSAGKLVFPVTSTTLPRRNALVVSTGPRGGGGLELYGALPCGKIYTIFLPMPEGNWTLQFCRPADKVASDASSTTVRLEPALVPPDPELEFDFQRLPVPPGKAHKLIVLKGALREDGTVDNLQVYDGVLSQMDEAARIAFSRWKFKPAMRGGNPLDVAILVGIPLGDANR